MRFQRIVWLAIVTAILSPSFGLAQNQIIFHPTDDAQVKSSRPTRNYGALATLRLREGSVNGTTILRSYLKFEVTGLTGAVQKATLRLFVVRKSKAGGSAFLVSNFFQGTTTPWDEASLNWNNAPAITSAALSSLGRVSVGEWVELDVTAAVVGNGTFSFGLKKAAVQSAQYSSKEAAPLHRPELVIVTGSGGGGGGNQPPVANAGNDQTVTDNDNGGDEPVTLDGSGSFDPDGNIVSYVWSEGGNPIEVGISPSHNFTVGTHLVTLAVTDNQGAVAQDQVSVTVEAAAGGGPGTVTVTPIDDAYVKSTKPKKNYGFKTQLKLKKKGQSTTRSYLKFHVAGLNGPVRSAKIFLRVTNRSDDGGTIFPASNNSQGSSVPWTEGSLTFSNAPETIGPALSSVGPVAVDDIVEFDVTSAVVADGVYSFCLENGSRNTLIFSSKEGSTKPRLVLETDANGNFLPVANAGPDQNVTDTDNSGSENVALDGSQSSDPDGNIVSYVWSEGGNQIAVGVNPNHNFTVGTHHVTLTVMDDQGATALDPINVTVDPAPGVGPQTVTANVIDDAYVRSKKPTKNFGASTQLKLKKKGSSKDLAYLKFNVTGLGGPVVSAKVRLKVTNRSGSGGTIFLTSNTYLSSNAFWNEAGLIFGNAPPITSGALSSIGPVAVDEIVEFDVTSAVVADGVYSFCIQPGSKNTLAYSSKEGMTRPELVVEYDPNANRPPIVDAGRFQLIDLGETNTTVLQATVSDDGQPVPPGALAFEWVLTPIDPLHPPEFPHPPEDGGPDQVVFAPNANVLNPTLTFNKRGLYVFRLKVSDGEVEVFDDVQILVLRQGRLPGPLSSIPVPGPDNLAAIDRALSSEIDGNPVPFSDFIVDKAAAIKLGKALFWEMQVGSDGIQACASCHFNAGADTRVTNELHPAGNGRFDVGDVNHTLSLSDFPYHKLSNPNDRFSRVVSDADDITGAMGVLGSVFNDITPGFAEDNTTPIAVDNPFNTGHFNVRRTTGRNAPPVINAVFNFRNFWDGRAFNNFNGVNPFGARDPNARVLMDTDGPGGTPASAVSICLPLSSAASQATGPPMSDVEMSGAGRIWPKLGKKLLHPAIVPLGKQLVDKSDSELGLLSNYPAKGLNTSYADLVKAAFDPRWWDSDNIMTFNPDGTIATIGPPPVGALTTDQYTLMEANFSMIFGLAVQCYEATLISDDAPFDRFRSGDANALTEQQKRGFRIFTNFGLDPTVPAGFCINCHVGPEFTSASVSFIGSIEPPQPFEPEDIAETIVERMPGAFGGGKASLAFVAGDAIGPAAGEQQVALGFDPRGKLLEVRDATGTVLFFGHMPGTPGPLPPAGPCVDDLIIVPLFSTGVLTDPLMLAGVEMNFFSNCSVDLSVELVGFPAGFYDFFVDGVKRGTMEAVVDVVYDIGYYDIGVRSIAEDIGNGGNDPFGNPLSLAKMELLQPGRADIRKGVPGGGLGGAHEFTPAIGALGEADAADGAFKVPTLRNVELTGPYFHNGGQATLRQVVDFYNRGGDFSDQNLRTLAPEIRPLGLTEQDKDDLVAFLLSLTDERVRLRKKPFDGPQFFAPDGHDENSGVTLLLEIPAVGAAGGPAIQPFLNGDPFLSKKVLLAVNLGAQGDLGNGTLPKEFGLEQNFPNPFNPSTSIHFALAKEVKTRLEVYNVLGQRVRTLVHGVMPAGLHTVNWDGKNDAGEQVGSGVYVYRLQSADFVRTRRMLMVK